RFSAAVTLASPPPSNRKSTKAASAGISINPRHCWCCPHFLPRSRPLGCEPAPAGRRCRRESDLGLAAAEPSGARRFTFRKRFGAPLAPAAADRPNATVPAAPHTDPPAPPPP